MGRTVRRRSSLEQLTGLAGPALGARVVLASAAGGLGYDENKLSGELSENEFGYRKRLGEASVRASGLDSLIVRSYALDDVLVAEGREPCVRGADNVEEAQAEGAVGVRDDEAKKRKINPRDLAAFLVASLAGASDPSAGKRSALATPGRAVEVWTYVEGEEEA